MTRWRKIDELSVIENIVYTMFDGYHVFKNAKYHKGRMEWWDGDTYTTIHPTHFLEITPPNEREMERERLVGEIIDEVKSLKKSLSAKNFRLSPNNAFDDFKNDYRVLGKLLDQLTETEGE